VRSVAAVVCMAALISGCGSSDKPTTRPKDDPGPPVHAVSLTEAGCSPQDFTLHPGAVEFRVTNRGSNKAGEMEVQTSAGHVVGDVEGVAPGHTRSFVVRLKVGSYRVRCPEEAPTGGTITVK
jgi:hypothetical protein